MRASSDLTAAMGTSGRGILTEVPPNQLPPYVLLGEVQGLHENDPCAAEAEIFATVHFWSRVSPPDKGGQATAMGAAISAALNAQLSLTDWTVDEWEQTDERYSTDPDQSTHGILIFHYLLTAS